MLSLFLLHSTTRESVLVAENTMAGTDDARLEDALKPLINSNRDLTPLQYLWQLKSKGDFLEIDEVRDASIVQKIVRKIKGPKTSHRPAGGAWSTMQQMDWKSRRSDGGKDYVGICTNMAGGNNMLAGRISGRLGDEHLEDPRDWPGFFLDPNADIHGKNLNWIAGSRDDGETTVAADSRDGSTSCARSATTRLTQKQRRRRSKHTVPNNNAQSPREDANGANAEGKNNHGPEHDTPNNQQRLFDELYIWLVDCYRMRCHDDVQWRGGLCRGIYEMDTRVERRLERSTDSGSPRPQLMRRVLQGKAANPTNRSVLKDFLLFAKLVAVEELYPPCFDFKRLLFFAKKLLPKRFQKEHAKFKYGDENALGTDRPSLRRAAEPIYGCSAMQQKQGSFDTPGSGEFWRREPHEYNQTHQYPERVVKVWKEVEKWFDLAMTFPDTFARCPWENSQGVSGLSSSASLSSSPDGVGGLCALLDVLSESHMESASLLFADVGGVQIWKKLYDSLDLVNDNFGLPHVFQMDPHVPPGSTVLVKNLSGRSSLSSGRRPVDLNGALCTFDQVLPETANGEQRYRILVRDGSTVALKAGNIEVHLEKTGAVSCYARMLLRNHTNSILNIDLDQSSSSDEDAPTTNLRFTDASGRFMRKRGLQNIGEARKCEESAKKVAPDRIYTYDQCEAEGETSDPLVGAVVEIRKLQMAEGHFKHGGCRGRITNCLGGDEVNVLLLPMFCEDENRHEQEVLRCKLSEVKFLDGRDGSDDDEDGRDVGLDRGAPKAEKDTRQCQRSTVKEAWPKEADVAEENQTENEAENPAHAKLEELEKRGKQQETLTSNDVKTRVNLLDEKRKERLTALIVQCLAARGSLSPRLLEDAMRHEHDSFVGIAKKAVEVDDQSKKQGKKTKKVKKQREDHWLVAFFRVHGLDAFGYDADKKLFRLPGAIAETAVAEDSVAAPKDTPKSTPEKFHTPTHAGVEGTPTRTVVDSQDSANTVSDDRQAASRLFEPETTTEDEMSDTSITSHKASAAQPHTLLPSVSEDYARRNVLLEPFGEELAEEELAENVAITEEMLGKLQHQGSDPNVGRGNDTRTLEEDEGEWQIKGKGSKTKLEDRQEAVPRSPRHYVVGTQFFISPADLYFTQDSIKNSFRNPDENIRETLGQLLDKKKRKRDIEIMNVVYHDGAFYSVSNRRLAVYMLLHLCGRCQRLKVEMIDKQSRTANWHRRFTTDCNGDWIVIRDTLEIIHRTVQKTTFKLSCFRN